MNKQGLRADNHYVPVMYLKNWADNKEKIQVYKTLVSHEREYLWRSHSAKAIAKQRHLYTQYISGTESDDFERWIDSSYESPAKEALDKAINDRKLSRDDWDSLIRFLACQDLRTPARLLQHLELEPKLFEENIKETLGHVINELESNSLSMVNRPEPVTNSYQHYPMKVTVTRDDNDKSLGRLRVTGFTGRSSWIISIQQLLNDLEPLLHSHRWTIIKPAKGYYWPTSDNPVIKLNYMNDKNYNFGGGWGREKGNIIFPIGPEHAVVTEIGDKHSIRKGTRLTESATVQLRKFIAEHAHRMIFSNRVDNELIGFRPRVVNSDVVKGENQKIKEWHESNKIIESEFF